MQSRDTKYTVMMLVVLVWRQRFARRQVVQTGRSRVVSQTHGLSLQLRLTLLADGNGAHQGEQPHEMMYEE